jgi:U3 small nucleolar RNA-associated protein 14
MNRLIERATHLTEKLDALPQAKRDALAASLTLDTAEFTEYQTIQSHAHADGTLSTDEAMTAYTALNQWHVHPEQVPGRTLAMRLVITQMVSELLKTKIDRFRKDTLPKIRRERKMAQQQATD